MDDLRRQVYRGLTRFQLLMAVGLFLPAGTLRFPEAWVYWAGIALLNVGITSYFLKRDPQFIEWRMKGGAAHEKRILQKRLLAVSTIAFAALWILPGLSRLLGSPPLPVWVVAMGDALCVAGYWIIFLTFRANRFASAIVDLKEGQRVIDSGPYRRVRHPMYSGGILFLVGTALALGSLWALIPAALLLVLIVLRLLDEERFLVDSLPGYREYRQRVRYRLMPGVW